MSIRDWVVKKLKEPTTYAGVGMGLSWFFGALNLDVVPAAVQWLNDAIVLLGSGYLLLANEEKLFKKKQ